MKQYKVKEIRSNVIPFTKEVKKYYCNGVQLFLTDFNRFNTIILINDIENNKHDNYTILQYSYNLLSLMSLTFNGDNENV